MIIENWEKIYQVQAVWKDWPTAEEVRAKLAPKAPAYQFKTRGSNYLLAEKNQVLHIEVKGLTSAIYVAESLLGLTSEAGIRAEIKIDGQSMFELLRRLSSGINNAVTILRSNKIRFLNRSQQTALNSLEETLKLDDQSVFIGC